MKRTLAIAFVFLFVVAVACVAMAEEKQAAEQQVQGAHTESAAPAQPVEKATAPAEPKPAAKAAPAIVKAAKQMKIEGKITAIENDAQSLTVKHGKASTTVFCSSDTQIMSGKEKKTLADLKAGQQVTVKYTVEDGKKMASSVSVRKMPAKKAAPKTEQNMAPASEQKAEPKTESK